MTKIIINDVTLRDAHQCLLATRMRTEDMLPICKLMDSVGYGSMEVWGGATYDTCLRFLKEDPWERLRQLRQALPNTKLSMLLRGQNVVGYRQYADDVVTEFVKLTAKNGIDIFRIFDALNDMRNLTKSIEVVKDCGKHAQGAISYTVSPVHDIKQFVAMAKEFEQLGCDSVAIKDMAGLLTPTVTETLVGELVAQLSVPVVLHSHSTSGLASICHYLAVKQGCHQIDTAISSFAGGASHPATESLVSAFQHTEYDSGLDLATLAEINDYFKEVRQKYHQFESRATGIDPRVQLYQVPGGMISNLYNQLKEQNALERYNEVTHEIPRVRKDLGYPPLVTPSSQVVGTQAVLNILTGKRYETITNEVKLYCQGKYGKPPAPIDEKVKQKAIGNADVIQGRPADEIPNELPALTEKVKDLTTSAEDIISLAIFPDIAKQFIEERNAGNLVPEPLEPLDVGGTGSKSSEFTISLHGEEYHVKFTGSGKENAAKRTFYLSLDGVPEELVVTDLAISQEELPAQQGQSKRPPVTEPGHVSVAMPSTVVDVNVKIGNKVNAGDSLIVTEAMKMETELKAPIDGEVIDIYCKKGDRVNPDEALLSIAPLSLVED